MANLGQNSSGNLQAIVRVTPEECLTEEFARLLEKNLVIELPDPANTPGRLDLLSASAVAQITGALAADSEFVSQLIGDSAFLVQLTNVIVASQAFKDAVNQVGVDDEDKLSFGKTELVTLDAALNVTISVPASSSFVFVFSVVNSSGDATDAQVTGTTSNSAVINFPNGAPGDTVTVNWIRTLTP
jgi:hypothetical protein